MFYLGLLMLVVPFIAVFIVTAKAMSLRFAIEVFAFCTALCVFIYIGAAMVSGHLL